jgi:hypothetical protein
MISVLEPLPIGNAIRVLMTPSTGAVQWTLLRKLADDFAGVSDPAAVVIYSGSDAISVLDQASLVNGVPVYYKLYEFDGRNWNATPTLSATPRATDLDLAPDVQELVRARLELALRASVAAGAIAGRAGYVPCFTAPPEFDQKRFPFVVVHHNVSRSDTRALGEGLSPDTYDSGSVQWVSSEGWLDRWVLDVTALSLNPDERIALRKAVRAAVVGNLPVFDDAGMVDIDFSMSDSEDFEGYGVPVYMANGSFSCLAPIVLVGTRPAIRDVIEYPTASNHAPSFSSEDK